MLPVIICEEDRELRGRWQETLGALIQSRFPSVRTEVLPGGLRELKRMADAEKGIMLVILGMRRPPEERIGLYSQVMGANRDNYVVLYIHDPSLLEVVFSECLRPAGILTPQSTPKRMEESLERVLDDYVSLHSPDAAGNYMTVTSDKTLRRVAYSEILYLEAQDKLINICTAQYALSIRGSLNAVEQELPDMFVRCHRSYIVNMNHVNRLDTRQMLLILQKGERIPVSRANKDGILARLHGGNE